MKHILHRYSIYRYCVGIVFCHCFGFINNSRDQKEERDLGEDNEEEDPKCSRKKKPKLSLKADSKEDGEERDDEMVSISRTTTREHMVFHKWILPWSRYWFCTS